MVTPAPEQEPTARLESDARRPPRNRGVEAQFAPGTIIAGRYRISSILGSGGMGEVYRADDTKLGQAVALKFLPARLARDPILLERLHDEVRLGRQIAHPNVCRIYDIIDWEDSHFVAMEYVDGEDLSRLLHRIGRLAHDKAVDIARGIAAGLHAAHGKGILHRDLKPANVMIDSHGEARIMDFGLALAAEDDTQDGVIAGTPAYMAPEQVAGQSATVQSDLYALGLVMYELFTGKRAHSGRTLNDRARMTPSEITTPSSVIRDIDPVVERVILRCLEAEPSQRPRSARQIIDSLPGGDPLAAALAAGETPSPRIVAAAGTEGSLRPRIAVAWLASIVVLMAGLLFAVVRGQYLQIEGLTKPPEVKAEQARAVLRTLGIPPQAFDAWGYEVKLDRIGWVLEHDKKPGRYERARRGLPVLTFWLREESRPMLDTEFGNVSKPERRNPPQHEPGSSAIEVDSRGRLFALRAIASPEWKARPVAWSELIAAAGLGGVALTPVAPSRLPPSYADARAAWTGRHPDDGTPIRIEAASWRGTPVFFQVLGPWDESAKRFKGSFGASFQLFMGTLITIAAIAGAVLARRNLRMRRGDRKAAVRVGAAIFILKFLSTILFAEHELALLHEVRIVVMALSQALLWSSLFCLVYLALEPYVRRRWPERLISWVRLVGGEWRDPMVGRDLMIGMAGGLVHIALIYIAGFEREHHAIGTWSFPPFGGQEWLLGDRLAGIAWVADSLARGIVFAMSLMIVLMLLTAILRRRAFAVAAFFGVMVAGFAFSGADLRVLPAFALICAVTTFILARYGLLAIAAYHAVFYTVYLFPLPDGIAWYTMRGLVAPVIVLAIAIQAFRTSLGEQKLFQGSLLED